jgi:hypothetical protein
MHLKKTLLLEIFIVVFFLNSAEFDGRSLLELAFDNPRQVNFT